MMISKIKMDRLKRMILLITFRIKSKAIRTFNSIKNQVIEMTPLRRIIRKKKILLLGKNKLKKPKKNP